MPFPPRPSGPRASRNRSRSSQRRSARWTSCTLLEKQNRRQDRQKAESLLAEERGLRATAVSAATDIQKDAAHWIELKRELPQRLDQMGRDYQAVHSFDLAPVTVGSRQGRNRLARKEAGPGHARRRRSTA